MNLQNKNKLINIEKKKLMVPNFPGGPVVKNPSANAGDMEDATCHGATKPVSHNS